MDGVDLFQVANMIGPQLSVVMNLALLIYVWKLDRSILELKTRFDFLAIKGITNVRNHNANRDT